MKVIYVDFKNKKRLSTVETTAEATIETLELEETKGGLSSAELDKLATRVDEINMAIFKCNPNEDHDLLFNLETELNSVIAKIETTLSA